MATAKTVEPKTGLALGQEVEVEPGIYKRQGKKGVSYRVKIREKGIKPMTQTFAKLADAKVWQVTQKNAIITGSPLDLEKTIKKLTLGEIFAEYVKGTPNISQKKIDQYKRLTKEIGGWVFANFKTKQFEEYINYKLNKEIPSQPKTKKVHPLFDGYKEMVDGKLVRRKYKPSTVRKYYYDIKVALQWHSKIHDYVFNSKPFDDVPAPAAWGEPRERVLHDGELVKLLQACNLMYKNKHALQCIILFQLYSSMRIGETLLMKWSEVHLDRDRPEESYIFVPKKNQKIKNKKNAKNRYVIFRPELYKLFEEIEKLPKHSSGRVFHQWQSSVTFGARFKVVCKNAGSSDFHPHDLRHCSISWLFEHTNLTDIEISNHSGHIELDTLKRYANLRPQKAGAKLWKYVGALTSDVVEPVEQPEPPAPETGYKPVLPKLEVID